MAFADDIAVLLLFLILSTEALLHCPRCEEAGNVVECNAATIRCAGNQVCRGTMRNLAVSMECNFPANCEAEVAMESVNCTGGGPFSSADKCHFCCYDLQSCQRKLDLVQKGIDGTSEVLHCPTCPRGTTDPLQCLRNLQPCHPSVKVCSVDWSFATVSAGCARSDVECRLHQTLSQFACQEEGLHEDAYCTRCCDNEDCWRKAFYITTTTTSTTTTTPTTTTSTTTTTTTLPPTTTPTTTSTTTTLPPTTTSTSVTSAERSTSSSALTSFTTTAETSDTTLFPTAPLETMLSSASLSTSKSTTTTSASTATSSTSSNPDTTDPVVATVARCHDNVKGDRCRQLSGVCHDPIGHVLCPHTCGFCDDDLPAELIG